MYVKVINGKAKPYALSALKTEYPNVSFPAKLTDAVLARFDIYPVSEASTPSFDADIEKIVVEDPVEVDGSWVRPKRVESLPQAEVDMKVEKRLGHLRKNRNNALRDSDWTQLADCQLTQAEKQEWITYRQSLRDLPAQAVNGRAEIPESPHERVAREKAEAAAAAAEAAEGIVEDLVSSKIPDTTGTSKN